MATKSTIKNIKKHRCDKCHFECSKLGDWNRHIITSKHINGNKLATENTSNITQYNCDECGKIYNDRSGLWRHKKKCNIIDKEMNKLTKDDDNDEILNNSNLILELLKEKLVFKELILEKPVPAETNDSLIVELLKQNQDFKDLMIEQNKYMMEQSKQMMELAKNSGNNTNIKR